MASVSADFETGDLSQFDNTATDSGDFSAHADAAMVGSYGGKFVVDDTNAMYGRLAFANKTRLRVGFYLDPNSLTMASSDQFFLCCDDSIAADYKLYLYYDGSNYKLRLAVRLDGGGWTTWTDIEVTVADAAHWVEFDLKRSSGAGNDDGFAKLWIDSDVTGAPDDSLTGLDDDTLYYDGVIVGAPDGLDAGTSGTFYIDHIIANDTGAAIGAPGSASLSPSASFSPSSSASSSGSPASASISPSASLSPSASVSPSISPSSSASPSPSQPEIEVRIIWRDAYKSLED
jgi:hypothetical protein